MPKTKAQKDAMKAKRADNNLLPSGEKKTCAFKSSFCGSKRKLGRPAGAKDKVKGGRKKNQ